MFNKQLLQFSIHPTKAKKPMLNPWQNSPSKEYEAILEGRPLHKCRTKTRRISPSGTIPLYAPLGKIKHLKIMNFKKEIMCHMSGVINHVFQWNGWQFWQCRGGRLRDGPRGSGGRKGRPSGWPAWEDRAGPGVEDATPSTKHLKVS